MRGIRGGGAASSGDGGLTEAQIRALPLLHEANFTYAGAKRMSGVTGGSYGDIRYDATSMSWDATTNSLWISSAKGIGRFTPGTTGWTIGADPTVFNDVVWDQGLECVGDASASCTAGTDNLSVQFGNTDWRAGAILHYGSWLYGGAYVYYDSGGTQTKSHYRRSPSSLANNTSFDGLKIVWDGDSRTTAQLTQPPDSRVSAWMSKWASEIPSGYRTVLGGPTLWSSCCTPKLERGSWGPSAFVIDPANIGTTTEPVDAIALQWYDVSHALGPYEGGEGGRTYPAPMFQNNDRPGGFFIIEGTRTAVLVSKHGEGDFCYGPGNVDPSMWGHDSGTGYPYCPDPEETSEGNHTYPYEYRLTLFDIGDWIDVKNGIQNPWEPEPYEWFDITFPNYVTGAQHAISGAAIDNVTHTMYVGQTFCYALELAGACLHKFTISIP